MPVTITATVVDDAFQRRRSRTLPADARGAPSPVNDAAGAAAVPGRGSVLWQVYLSLAASASIRGPKVTGGKVEVKATFSTGTYTLRAFGHDSLLRAPYDVTVIVEPNRNVLIPVGE